MFEWPDFLCRAILGAVGLSLAAAPFGAVMVWRRMAYYGDTVSHAGLLGATLAFLMSISQVVGFALVAIAVALGLIVLGSRTRLANDTLLGILSHTFLAAGLVALALLETPQLNILGLLYGDILAISWWDVWAIAAFVVVGAGFMLRYWGALLCALVHPDMAKVDGIPIERLQFVHTILLALLIAFGIQIAGVLLMTALLIIPVAAARQWSHSPEQMVLLGALLGTLGVLGGFWASWYWDIPTGAAIVLAQSTFFLLTLVSPRQI